MTYNNKYKLYYIILLLSIPASIYAASITSWWWLLAGFFWSRTIGLIFVSIGLHRYFAHRSFQTGKRRHLFLAVGSVLTGSGSPVSWATHHPHHHRHSDKSLDIHSPGENFLNSCLLWPLQSQQYFTDKKVHLPRTILRDTVSFWIHNNYFLLVFCLAFLLLIVDWRLCLFLFLLPASLQVVLGNLLSNACNHLKLPGSYRNFDTDDNSYNNKFIHLILLGEGYHNNHHAKMNDYNFAKNKNEYDPGAYIIDKFFRINNEQSLGHLN